MTESPCTNGRSAAGSDVIVIGAGLAGLMAAVHAVRAGARVRLIAQGWGQQMVTPGWISVCDRADDDVIAEVRGYAALHPDHPYALAEDDAFVCGIEGFRRVTAEMGLPYTGRRKDGHNMYLPTMMGAIQHAMLAPQAIANGDLTDIKEPVLLVGFQGWRDFNPTLAAGNLKAQGIDARVCSIELPEVQHYWDMWPNDLANQFDLAHVRQAVIRQMKSHVQGMQSIGFAAVLGMDKHMEALDELSQGLGYPVFEIPTLPPNSAGTRLSKRFRRWLLQHRVRVQIGHPVVRGIVEGNHCTGVEVEALGHHNTFYADHFVLATGGLYNGGIQSDAGGRLWEAIFDLPVEKPSEEGRTGWYHDQLLLPRGHPVHRHSGIRVNKQMRPLNPSGEVVLDNVYVVGHMLAGFNPLTDGCAEGIALATAYKAIRTALE